MGAANNATFEESPNVTTKGERDNDMRPGYGDSIEIEIEVRRSRGFEAVRNQFLVIMESSEHLRYWCGGPLPLSSAVCCGQNRIGVILA